MTRLERSLLQVPTHQETRPTAKNHMLAAKDDTSTIARLPAHENDSRLPHPVFSLETGRFGPTLSFATIFLSLFYRAMPHWMWAIPRRPFSICSPIEATPWPKH